MKALFTLLALAFSGVIAAQSGTSGKFLFSDTARDGLRHIVDSMNLDFSASENKTYHAPLQGRGDYFFIRGDETANALKDIAAGVPFTQMRDKYTMAEMQPDILVARNMQEIDSVRTTSFSVISMGYLMPTVFFKGSEAAAMEKVAKGWMYNYDEKENAINAFYFSREMTAPELPERYARLIQYKDHMMRDGDGIYFDYAWECTPPYIYIRGPKMQVFFDDLNKKLKRPLYEDTPLSGGESTETGVDTIAIRDAKIKLFHKRLANYHESRMARVDSLMQQDAGFRKLFNDALDEARNHLSVTDEEFEEYAEAYASKEDALYFKRCRKVVSEYPEDSEPYMHRISIARLAAETQAWDVYIAAQVAVLNEKLLFTREYDSGKSDFTFVKELEAINVNAVDFLLGSVFKVDEMETYFGLNHFKLTKPFAEALDREYAGNTLLAMIADNDLDGVNRVMAYRISLSYLHFLKDQGQKDIYMRRMEEAMAYLPEYLIMTRPD